MSLPLLYSFRRCPYAMRARLALWVSGTRCELREVVLRDKPPSLLEYSPKATVPVLVLESGEVIDESLDVMLWALRRSDPQTWLSPSTGDMEAMLSLIESNDKEFKHHLDRYKYADRYDDVDPAFHRTQAERFLSRLEARLSEHPCLFGSTMSLADAAIGPFIRQFANTNRQWFDSSPYPRLKDWLERFIQWPLFLSVMRKYPQWHQGDALTEVPELLGQV
ncbi:MAG: glutathione S-transferase [Myxococcales bacterium]|nr:glutathione S-transferase [Myxococcales bacterium]